MKKISIKWLALLALTLGMVGLAPAAEAATSNTRQFIRQATIGNGFEIMSSRVALDRSRNPEVRDFAQHMIDAHRQADEELRNHITSSRYSMRNMPNDLDRAHRDMVNRLKRASGPAFDRMYLQMQTQAHDQAVALYSRYARNGDNPELRELARDLLPELQEHQQHVRQIRFTR